MSIKGQLFIVSGPSGAGKDTLLKEFFKREKDVKFSISTTTREKRPGDDGKYNFVTREQFENDILKDKFLEYAQYCGNFYGTPSEPIEKWIQEGHDVIVEIEVQGAQKVMAKNPDVASIFIMPPSVEVLKNRLCGRSTDEVAQIEARLQTAIYEMAFAEKYDYVVFNDNLEDAVQQLVDIFKADRSKSSRNIEQIKEVCKYA
ncbi:MAG: guanylate kinase [Clostridia bacterium]|nr:guanylate kinase [Clostridia bacterium]